MMDEKTFFMEGTIRICSHLEIENAMFACLETLRRVMPAEGLYLQYYDPRVDAMRISAKATKDGGAKINGVIALTPKGKADIEAWTLMLGDGLQPEPLIIGRPETQPVCKSMLEFHGIGDCDSSLLIIILGIEDTPFGSIAVHAIGHDRFNKIHARYLNLLREPFAIAVSNARKHLEVIQLKDLLADDNRYLHREMLRISGDQIIGREFGLKPVMDMVQQVAGHQSPVLLLGETGVGKDIIANAIHYSSSRADGPFITVNCGAIPGSLLDSELFGYEKGAFTGALAQKRGRFERADKGTIFLDEVGELTPEAQVRLLHVLQNRKIERVGGTKTIPVDIRVIAATNRNLEQMAANRQFREDLWFRLNVFPIMIPPLRARRADIPALADYFIEKKALSLKLQRVPDLAAEAIDQLLTYRWPGNVRELENVVERALILNTTGPVAFEMLKGSSEYESGQDCRSPDTTLPLFENYTTAYLRRALAMTKGRINGPRGAAVLTGLNPSTLRNKLKKQNIPFGHTSS